MDRIALFVKDVSMSDEEWDALPEEVVFRTKPEQKLYRVWPAMGQYYHDARYDFVVASAVTILLSLAGGPETLIFGSNPKGEIVSFSTLGGGRGTLDHVEAFSWEGYRVMMNEPSLLSVVFRQIALVVVLMLIVVAARVFLKS